MRNIGGRDPIWRVPLRALIPYAIGASLYAMARAYILLEAAITLRVLTPGAFQTVDWSAVVPHF
jgi:hypothetical protein